MAISSSLYSSISGLSTMGEAMSVLGDNVANVNTVAFKSSRSTFQDVLSQSVSTASGAAEVGRGVTLSAINSLFAQGSFESSSSPTDMAIGGQGFFMLRAADSAEADMYTRAGEFGFDQTGNLVNQMNHFVQGWTISSTTGEREGAITDINLGKNTPPVATKSVEVIANLDSRKTNEVNEDRLYANWNGTNAAGIPPTDPIDANKYDYTTAIKIYDSKGASHDLAVYFDRTTRDNQWEFLVTCDPTEDQRVLTDAEKVIYNPDDTYNYINHKGAGALMYGIIDFDTSGNIQTVDAFSVPPDGMIDVAKPENRMRLDASTSYFSIPTNFNGDTTNQSITLNLGARYEGRTDTIPQILVSDAGARALATGGDVSSAVTSATLWSRVADTNGVSLVDGDMFIFEGYDNGSDPVQDGTEQRLVYQIDLTKDVQDLLTQLAGKFGCSASVDGEGRLRLSDSTTGDSSMYVTRFETISAKGSTPFGGQSNVPNAYEISDDPILTGTGAVVTSAGTTLAGLRGSTVTTVEAGDTFTFSGTDVEGTAFSGFQYTVGALDDISVMLSDMESWFTHAYDYAISSGSVYNATTGNLVTDDSTLPGAALTNVAGSEGTAILAADTFTLSGVGNDGLAIVATPFPAIVAGVTTIRDLLDFIETTYDGAGAGTVEANLDADGRIRVVDTNQSGDMVVTLQYDSAGATDNNPFGLYDGVAATLSVPPAATSGVRVLLDGDGKIRVVDTAQSGNLAITGLYNDVNNAVAPLANPWGFVDGTPTLMTAQSSVEGMINYTTSKAMVVSTGRGFSTDTGDTNPFVATTQWGGVYDDNSTIGSGMPRPVALDDSFTFSGRRSDGSDVTSTYVVTDLTDSIQDLLDQLEDDFNCQASIDSAGRLVLTDWVADTVNSTSDLQIIGITYTYPGNTGAGPWPDTSPDIFGPGKVVNGTNAAVGSFVPFDIITPDIGTEDGSQEGDVVSTNFSSEALSTTQYANSSTTIFQDQDGFASGFLQSVSTDVDGIITGHYSNGQVLKKAQVALANFSNLAGLSKRGGNIFVESTESGAPVTGPPGTNGLGSIAPNALEQSNVDLGVEFVKLITVQRGFQANSKIITTTDDMLNELINIKR